MKTILLAINTKYVHSSLAVWYLAEGVKRYSNVNHDVKIIEATINQNIDDILQRIFSENPDVVGISVYIWNVGMLPKLLNNLQQRFPNIKIVLGGPEATHTAEFWLENGADYVICGEGERSFAELLDSLSECKSENEIRDPDTYINPYSDEYFESLGGRIAYIETSRGCPFDCAYCLSGSTGVKFFPLDEVKEQIYKLSESGTRTIKFVDRTFNCNPKRAYEIFKYIINLNSECCFHFEIAADLLDEPILNILKTAPFGRIQFEIGLQSFNKQTLDAVSRKTDLEKAENNIRNLLAMRNIHVHIDLIAGLPYETLDIFKDSFDHAYSIGADMLQLGFLKLLHGSKLRTLADDFGIKYNVEPPYQIISNAWLSSEDLKTLKIVENALQHTYNKGRFLSVLQYVLSVSGLRPFLFFQGLGEFVHAHLISLNVMLQLIGDNKKRKTTPNMI